jgi:hypothetical protein
MGVTPPGKPVSNTPQTGQQHSYDLAQAARLVAQKQLSSRTGTAAYGAQVQAVSDPFSKLHGYKAGFQDTGRLCTGLIVDGTAIANCYKVFVEKSRAPIIASALSTTSQVCFGASAINTYAPGTPVVVMIHDRLGQAYIVGCVPNVLDIGKRAYHDYISQATRKRVDDCQKKYIKEKLNGQMVDWSCWRPWDATLASEWGAMTTTGAGITLDDFMFRASINEFCGVYGFYHDQMLRVAGYNMQVWTAGSERDAYMDQAECNDSTGYSPYPWEAAGLIEPGLPMVQEFQPKDYQCPLGVPYYAHWENKNEFQQPYHRTQKFFGYLGQGSRTITHAPPKGVQRWTYKPGDAGEAIKPYESSIRGKDGFTPDCGGGSKEKEHNEKPVYGLQEDNTALDGRRFITSSKGIVLSKRILLPMPQRLRRPESGEGDDAERNYKAASKYGSGPDHKITGDIKTTDSKWPNMQRATAVLDLHGYLFNYAGLHPFYWHANDYKTWEEQDLKSEGYAEVNQKIPEFSQLKGSMYLKEPTPKQWKIDHRYNEQKFYEQESYISLLEDGGVVIGDGYGGEIRMVAGCVTISAPGDVWLKGGRDVQAWGGNDVILRSNKSIDISATEKNVRIKAERNVLVFAGNETSDREGGILLESRGKTIEYDFEQCGDEIKFAGVVARAPYSNVVGLAHQIYLRTGGGDIKPGDIVIDASTGSKDIVTKSNNLFNYLKEAGEVYHFFGGQKVGGTNKANMFRAEQTLLCGPIGTDGDIFCDGNVLCNGSVLVSKGHILTEQAARGAIFVGPCDGDCQAQVRAAIDIFKQLIDNDIPQVGDDIDEKLLQELWYKEKRAGNDDTINKIEFSFRRDDDYKIPDFMLYEDRWQQMARIGGKSTEKWTERPVSAKTCGPTWPFPGDKWLNAEPAYVEQDLKIVQNDGGYIDKRRNAAPGLAAEYKEPEFKSNTPKIINGNYPIIPRP